jgi:23S rRNA (pseudouridine1915-N3)-methyltransferase
MRVRIIWLGKTRDSRLRELIDDYAERLAHFVRLEVTELREGGRTDKAGIDRDLKRISDALPANGTVIALDPRGIEWTSEQLAAEIQKWENSGTKEVALIIGGPSGLSSSLISRADKSWSLTRLTLTHEMARVLVLEQLYRAYTIIHGLPYQK